MTLGVLGLRQGSCADNARSFSYSTEGPGLTVFGHALRSSRLQTLALQMCDLWQYREPWLTLPLWMSSWPRLWAIKRCESFLWSLTLTHLTRLSRGVPVSS